MVAAIVVYSNTGNTRRVAEAVGKSLAVPVASLLAPMVKPTPWAVLRLGFATLFGGTTPVQLQGANPAGAELVVLAAPVWAGRLSVPMRSWLATHPALPERVALVMTGGAPTVSPNAFADFASHAGRKPVATFYASEAEVKAGTFTAACEAFCRKLAMPG